MPDFQYQNGKLYCEEVPLTAIAAAAGTPVYVYSERALERHVCSFDRAFGAVPHLLCYAVKANSNLSILRRFSTWGTGFEVVSGGELFRVLKAGGSSGKTIFSGVGKTAEEIRYALGASILFFNMESASELELIEQTAASLGTSAPISIRTNPDIDPRTHPYISTGMQKHKFGVGISEALDLFKAIRYRKNVHAVGIMCHIGSQITAMAPFEEALASIRSIVLGLNGDGIRLKYLNFGGGLGISYDAEEPPSPETYARSVVRATRDLGLTLVLEPGRVITGNAGILLTRVLLRKTQGRKEFVVVDAGMNDLIRPALYGSFHKLWPVEPREGQEVVDVVGPVCESADFIAQNRELPPLRPGDLLAVMSAGAYGFSLSSNYNSRPRAAEVLVRGETYQTIRKRETYEDLVRLED